MNKFQSVKEWFTRDYLQQIKPKSISTDLDYFLSKNADPLCFVSKGIEMLNELISLCEEERILELFMPCIIIPLKCAEHNKIVTFDPKSFSLEDELHELSPGDICLIERNDIKHYTPKEEYRCHVEIKLPVALNKNCRVYYRCIRDEEDMKNNWEFYRYIYIEHYTDNLLNL